MTLREAAQRAIEALESIQRCIGFGAATIHHGSATWCENNDTIEALRQALAQPESEPKGVLKMDTHASNREALITQHRARAESAKLRGPNYSPCISADELLKLLDMLEADAQEIARLKVAFGKLRKMAPEGLGIGLFIANTLEGL